MIRMKHPKNSASGSRSACRIRLHRNFLVCSSKSNSFSACLTGSWSIGAPVFDVSMSKWIPMGVSRSKKHHCTYHAPDTIGGAPAVSRRQHLLHFPRPLGILCVRKSPHRWMTASWSCSVHKRDGQDPPGPIPFLGSWRDRETQATTADKFSAFFLNDERSTRNMDRNLREPEVGTCGRVTKKKRQYRGVSR